MKLLVLSHDDVRALLTPDDCVEAMADALAALARGGVEQPLRTVFRPEGSDGLMALMPVYRRAAAEAQAAAADDLDALYGLKSICIFPGNPQVGKDAHQGGVLLFSGRTGEPLALINGSAITEVRTAAVSALATRLLARPESRTLAIVGTGVQAQSHVHALTRAMPGIERVRLAGRDPVKARSVALELAGQVNAVVESCAEVADAMHGADIVVTATNSAEPVLRREWLAPGTHVNAVGSSVPSARELDTATMAQARLFVDRRESALNESGDYLFAAREGAISPDHIVAELGELLIGVAAGRRDADELTVFKSLGLAVQDLAAAALVYAQANKQGRGSRVEF